MTIGERLRSPWGRAAWFTLRQILLAVPFGLLFGFLWGGGWPHYWMTLRAALVISFCIGLSLALALRVVLPRLLKGDPALTGSGLAIEVTGTTAAAVVGSLVGGAIIHFTHIIPGFMGSVRAFVIALLYTLIFTSLFAGVIYAYLFHRQFLGRARAEEQAKVQLTRAELRALRAQVNPHFLFNTLNSIAALIASDPPRAEVMTERLAEVFRYALRSSEREHVSLREELEFVRSYLEIERARLGERLKVEEEVDPRALLCVVPPLVLQPLVENAVFHGAARRPEGGRVRLSAALRDEGLVLEVEDDGPGFEPGGAQGDGFGLQSVRERMRALGVGHGLELETAPGRGTRARVRLPMTTMHETEGRIER